MRRWSDLLPEVTICEDEHLLGRRQLAVDHVVKVRELHRRAKARGEVDREEAEVGRPEGATQTASLCTTAQSQGGHQISSN